MSDDQGWMHRDTQVIIGISSQAEGAWPNGTRVRKINSEPQDGHQDGAEAVVTGSLGPMEFEEMEGEFFLYFVAFDDIPEIPIGVSAWRLEQIDDPI